MITATEPQVVDTGRYSVKESASALNISTRTLLNHTNGGLIHCEIRKVNGRKFYFGYEIKRYWRAKY
jgi:DNA-binding transcriptional MerR regulator